MTTGLSSATSGPAPAPAVNRKYQAIGNTLRHLQDGRAPVEIFTDDTGECWAVRGPVLSALIARVELAVAERSGAPR